MKIFEDLGTQSIVGETKVLKEQKKYFNFYLKLPSIIAIIIFFLYFIWATIAGSNFGMFDIETDFGAWLIWMIIGTISSLITYYILKLSLSYKILHICYLDKLCSKLYGEEVLK